MINSKYKETLTKTLVTPKLSASKIANYSYSWELRLMRRKIIRNTQIEKKNSGHTRFILSLLEK